MLNNFIPVIPKLGKPEGAALAQPDAVPEAFSAKKEKFLSANELFLQVEIVAF